MATDIRTALAPPPGAGTPELAARFAVLSLAVAALFWTLIGALGGAFYRRFA